MALSSARGHKNTTRWRGIEFQRILRERVLHFLSLIHPRAPHGHSAEMIPDGIDRHLGASSFMPDEIAGLKLGIHIRTSSNDESLRRDSFDSKDIILVAKAEDFHDSREPPLRLGDIVMHNTGGPRMIVVDADAEHVITAWHDDDGEVNEAVFPRPCCHRITPL